MAKQKPGQRLIAAWIGEADAQKITEQARREGRSVASVVKLSLRATGYLSAP